MLDVYRRLYGSGLEQFDANNPLADLGRCTSQLRTCMPMLNINVLDKETYHSTTGSTTTDPVPLTTP